MFKKDVVKRAEAVEAAGLEPPPGAAGPRERTEPIQLSSSLLGSGEHRAEHPGSSQAWTGNGPVASAQKPPDSRDPQEASAEPGCQDADDEATEDTDDTR